MHEDIVGRQQFNEIPPRVEYELTEKGQSVVPILQTICHWSIAYHREDNENTLSKCKKCNYHTPLK
ncbi:MAG: winged helix-turn-helix transcriptional regulator [Schwartzia sp. (in: firmicutes)]